MSVKYILTAFAAALIFVSCGKKQEKPVETAPVEETKTEPSIHRLPEYHFTDSVQVGQRTYVYTLHREAVDSLGSVSDEYGDHYVNTFYTLDIKRGGSQFYSKRFTKQTLAGKLPADFMKNGILDGFRFFRVDDGKLVFSLCVSYPDSDLSSPFLLTIGPDGSSTITKDELMDVEPDDAP